MNQTLIRSSCRALFALAIALAACAPSEEGKIPCDDTSNCPSDFPTCSASKFCVAFSPAVKLVAVSGDAQSAGVAGSPLPAALVVAAQDVNGAGVPGVTVTWAVTAGGGSVTASSTTGADGTATVTPTLGNTVATNTFTATASGLSPGTVTFNELSIPGPTTSFAVSFPANIGVQVPGTATVTAKDKNNNSSAYTGHVNVTVGKPDAVATLPANFALTITPATPGTISGILFGTAATGQTLIVTDTTTASITGTSSSFNVASGTTTTVVTSNHLTAVFGQSVTFTAVVTPGTTSGTVLPTGNVTFFSGATAIGTVAVVGGQAQLSTSTLSVGAHSITAQYLGDAGFAGSTSAAITETINQANTTVTLASGLPSSTFGQSVTFTATVLVTSPGAGTPTGTVAFRDGATNIALCATQALAGTAATCSTAALTAGTHSITAIYNGDTNFAASPASNTVTQTVAKAATTASVALTTGTSPSVFGQAVTFTATVSVTSPGAGTPTGSVAFRDNGTNIAACATQTLTGTTATCTVSLSVGTHPITVIYSGDTNFLASPASTAISQVVNKADTTVSLASNPNPSQFGQSVTFTATVVPTAPGAGSPTGNVTFRDAGVTIGGCATQAASGTTTVTATCTLASLSVGTHSITATYNGDGNFNASPLSNTVSQQVIKGSVTVSLTSAPNSSTFGQSVTFTATLTVTGPAAGTPTGNVTFQDTATNIGACAAQPVSGTTTVTATCTISTLSVGTHPVTATYNGDANFNASPASNTVNQVVIKANTAISVASDNNPSTFGETVNLIASITTTPAGGTTSGTVTFNDGATAIAGCTGVTVASNSATCTTTALTAGTHSITATYNGDGSFNPSTSAAVSQVVIKASTSTAVTSASPSVVGQQVTFTATITTTPAGGSPTGSVAFKDGATVITGCASQTVTASSATCTTSALILGSHAITAVYSGDSNFLTSTSGIDTQQVNKANTSVSLGSAPNPSTFGQPVTFTAAVSVTPPGAGTPTGSVTFAEGATNLPGCAGQTLTAGAATCTLSSLPVGTHSITATYNGDGNFNTSSSTALTQTVNKATPSVSITATQPGGVGANVNFAITVTGTLTTPTGTVNVSPQGSPASIIATCTLNGAGSCAPSASVPPGSTAFVASYGGDGNYNAATGTSAVLNVQSVPSPGPAVVISGGPSDGKVLLVAGQGVKTSLFDPATSAQIAGPALSVSRSSSTATAIGNGQILIAGGNGNGGSTFEVCSFGAKASCAPAGAMISPRCNAAAALIGSSVLVAGGDDCSGTALASWDLWSADGVVSSTAASSLSEARASLTATALAGGTVLLAGGGSSSAELFKLADLSVTKLPPMLAARTGHTATLLPSGSKACASGSCVFLAGGAAGGPAWETFDVAANSFGRPANAAELLNPSRASHAAALLADGRVLIAGGKAGNQAIETSETFDGARFAPGPALQTARTGAGSAFLPALDLLLLAGGSEAPELLTAP